MRTTDEERKQGRYSVNSGHTLSSEFGGRLLYDLEDAIVRADVLASIELDHRRSIAAEFFRRAAQRPVLVEDPKPLCPDVDDPGVDFCVGAFFGGLIGTFAVSVVIALTIIHYFWR